MTNATSGVSQPLSATDLDRLRPKLHRYCTRMVGSALDGEDIVQDALVRALEAASTEQPIANPDGWLFRIAHNLALDHLRRRARRGDTHNEDDMDSLAHPVDDQSRRDAAAATLSTFMRLPASQRSVVILFDVLEYSAEEVAEILETTVPAMKSILQRGRNRLRMLARNPAEQQARVPLQKSEQQARVPLQKSEQQLLRRYVDLFNARDFDTLRTMLAADVRLDLVNRAKLQGPAVGELGHPHRDATVSRLPGHLRYHVHLRRRQSEFTGASAQFSARADQGPLRLGRYRRAVLSQLSGFYRADAQRRLRSARGQARRNGKLNYSRGRYDL